MGEPDTTDQRSTNPLGIIVALGALGVLLVMLFFNSSPSTDLPPDQGPMAMALVSNMMTNGVLVDYECARNTAWVNRAVWTRGHEAIPTSSNRRVSNAVTAPLRFPGAQCVRYYGAFQT